MGLPVRFTATPSEVIDKSNVQDLEAILQSLILGEEKMKNKILVLY